MIDENNFHTEKMKFSRKIGRIIYLLLSPNGVVQKSINKDLFKVGHADGWGNHYTNCTRAQLMIVYKAALEEEMTTVSAKIQAFFLGEKMYD